MDLLRIHSPSSLRPDRMTRLLLLLLLVALLSTTPCTHGLGPIRKTTHHEGYNNKLSRFSTHRSNDSVINEEDATLSSSRSPETRVTPDGTLCTVAHIRGGARFAKKASASPAAVDYEAIGKWLASLTFQMSLIFGLLSGIDKLMAPYFIRIPLTNFLFFYAFNLRTSVFSLLPTNARVERQKLSNNKMERKRPSWTPPGIVFAIMWPLFVFGLRAATASMVVASSDGKYATPAIMSLMLHFGIGSLWNTVNTVERRLGPSVILLYLLWATKVHAVLQFYKVNPLAGKLLALTLTWITAAAVLQTNTWQINPDPDTNCKEPLYPVKQGDKWKTKFRWEV